MAEIGGSCHRRIQDFVRGGQGPLDPRGGQGPLCPPGSGPDYLGEQFCVGRGGGPRCGFVVLSFETVRKL